MRAATDCAEPVSNTSMMTSSSRYPPIRCNPGVAAMIAVTASPDSGSNRDGRKAFGQRGLLVVGGDYDHRAIETSSSDRDG